MFLSYKSVFGRCKLEAYLLQMQDGAGAWSAEQVMSFLKQLPAPAVDLQLRALCTHAEDEDGVRLLRLLLRWLGLQARSGDNFELVQGYLHRTLVIYAELLTQVPALAGECVQLAQAHREASSRFRDLVQKNLCLLKIIGKIPIT